MGWLDTTITCPKCFTKHKADDLKESLEYGCWAAEEEYVYCPDCDFGFTVQCEHAGFTATDNFDNQSFHRAHKIKIPEGVSRIFVDHYFEDLRETGTTSLHSDPQDRYQQNAAWEKAYEFAIAEWKRLQISLGNEDYLDEDPLDDDDLG